MVWQSISQSYHFDAWQFDFSICTPTVHSIKHQSKRFQYTIDKQNSQRQTTSNKYYQYMCDIIINLTCLSKLCGSSYFVFWSAVIHHISYLFRISHCTIEFENIKIEGANVKSFLTFAFHIFRIFNFFCVEGTIESRSALQCIQSRWR